MVLDRKTNFFLGKRWFGRKKPTFSYGFGKENHLFPGENKKKKTPFETLCG